MSDQLPAAWTRVRASEVCTNIPNGSTPPAELMLASGEIPFVKVYNLTLDGQLDFTKQPTFISRDTHERLLKRSRSRPGDVLMNIVGPPLGKVSILPATFQEWNFNQAVVAFQVQPDRLDNRFLALYLVHESARWASRFSKATVGQHNISVSDCRNLELPLPPLAEQRRIVDRVEAARCRSRRAREALDSIPPLLEKLRQSILASAFRGDLTMDWRAKHPDVEPASELLKRIRVERRKKWEEAELAKMVAKGKSPKDDRWKAKYEEPKPVDATGLPELPGGWCWASLDMALESLRNGVAAKPDRPSGQRILRISAVRPLRLNPDDVRFLHEELDVEAYQLRSGDLLLTRYNGNPDLVGAAAVVRRLDVSTVYPDKLIRAVPAIDVATADFLELAINCGATRRHIAGKAKSAAGQVGVSGDDIRTAPVPIPPMREQAIVCERVAALLANHDALLNSWASAATSIPRLERAVLAMAFRGGLVPQNADEEPRTASGPPDGPPGGATRPPPPRRGSTDDVPDNPTSGARPKRTRRKAS